MLRGIKFVLYNYVYFEEEGYHSNLDDYWIWPSYNLGIPVYPNTSAEARRRSVNLEPGTRLIHVPARMTSRRHSSFL